MGRGLAPNPKPAPAAPLDAVSSGATAPRYRKWTQPHDLPGTVTSMRACPLLPQLPEPGGPSPGWTAPGPAQVQSSAPSGPPPSSVEVGPTPPSMQIEPTFSKTLKRKGKGFSWSPNEDSCPGHDLHKGERDPGKEHVCLLHRVTNHRHEGRSRKLQIFILCV